MQSKNNLNLVQKSSIFACFLVFFIIFPQNSSQQSVIPGTCVYSYDSSTGLYLCRLTATVANPTDILNITGNHLQGKTDIDVKIVKYSGNTIKYLNGDILNKFENLIILVVDAIGMKEVSESAFENCTNLEEFTTNISDLSALPPLMMQNCKKLKRFKATAQQFSEIPEIFGDTTSLEELSLYYNHLRSLPENLLKNKPNLKIFNVRDNELTELALNFFADCPNLEEVYISYNDFQDQDKFTRAFNGNTNLKKLKMDTNNFHNFDFSFFSQFDKLEMLAVGTTFDPQLSGISWQSLPISLIDLTVESIGKEVPENSFNHLVNLVTLSLSGSGITSFHKDTFKAQTELKYLSVQNSNLRALHPELFVSQVNLIDLTLRYNKIEELPVGIFAPLVNLGSQSSINGLKLADNKIKRLNSNSFGQHPNLQNIDFASNQIEAIERGLFNQFSSFMYRANFNSNVCVSKLFSDANNLNDDASLNWCFDSWDGITTATTTTTTTTLVPPTTPGGCGSNFKKFEVFGIIFIGFLGVLINFV